MKNRVKSFVLVAGIYILISASVALAADFSADMINRTKAGVFKGKIFVSKDKTRMETPEGITITRMDKKAVWIIMPKEKMYMEQAFDPGKAAATTEKVNGEIERKLLGQETIDGRKTDKYLVTYTQNRKKETMLQWIASGIGMPVKMAAEDNSWTVEYKNIKTGKQPDQLFEVPEGYEKFSAGMPSMKDMFKKFGR